MAEQVQQARELLLAGLPLTRQLPGRIAYELKLVVHGGLRILERLEQLHYDIFFHRPTLSKRDWMLLLWRALRYSPRRPRSDRKSTRLNSSHSCAARMPSS